MLYACVPSDRAPELPSWVRVSATDNLEMSMCIFLSLSLSLQVCITEESKVSLHFTGRRGGRSEGQQLTSQLTEEIFQISADGIDVSFLPLVSCVSDLNPPLESVFDHVYIYIHCIHVHTVHLNLINIQCWPCVFTQSSIYSSVCLVSFCTLVWLS